MIRDRGNQKWRGFFMPEHIKMLKDAAWDDLKTPRPQLDETQIEDMERLLAESLTDQKPLEITTWKDGFFTQRVGTVTKIDRYSKKITIQDELDANITINFFTITHVSVL